MTFIYRICGFLFAATLLLPAAIRADEPKVADLAWLAGAWKYEAGGDSFEEVWLAPIGETMIGMGRHTKGGKHQGHEFLRLAIIDGALQYEAQPSGQKPTLFKLTNLKGQQAVFENPTHDFPTKISYRRDGDSLTAKIEGTRNGKTAAIEFQFKRVDAER